LPADAPGYRRKKEEVVFEKYREMKEGKEKDREDAMPCDGKRAMCRLA
jgi:hypothetical protein